MSGSPAGIFRLHWKKSKERSTAQNSNGSEQKSWDLLYAKGKREILYQAVNMVNQVEYLNGKNAVEVGIVQRAEELRNLIYWQRRSFDTIRDRTAELRQALEALVRKNTAA